MLNKPTTNSINIIETQNCYAGPFNINDFDLLYSLHSDPEIMFYIGHGTRTKEQVATHLENIINHQNKHGYSAWAIFEKATGSFVGRVGLIHIGTIIAIEKVILRTRR